MCLIYRDSDSGADFLNEESRYGNEILVQKQATRGLACRRHTYEGVPPIQRKSDVRDVQSVFSEKYAIKNMRENCPTLELHSFTRKKDLSLKIQECLVHSSE